MGRQPQRRRRGGGRQRRCVLATRKTTGGGGIILHPLLAAVSQLLLAQPLVVGGYVTPPEYQVACNSAHLAAVEQQLRLVLALLSRVRYGPRGRRGPDTLKERFDAVDVDGSAAACATRQRGV